MIGTIRHKALRQFFETGVAKGLPVDMASRLKRMLSAMHAAEEVEQLGTIPGWRLHPLKGGRQGQWSLSVSGNWRLVFSWQDGVANDVDFVDYH
jgi:proteic killer suppression protein